MLVKCLYLFVYVKNHGLVLIECKSNFFSKVQNRSNKEPDWFSQEPALVQADSVWVPSWIGPSARPYYV